MIKHFFFKSNNHKLHGVYERTSKSKITAILLHGLTNSYNSCPLINDANDFLIKNSISTFRFDYYGSGESDGRFSDKTVTELIENTKDAYKYAIQNLKAEKIIVWGRSFGAILAPVISFKPEIIASILISGTTHTHISMKNSFQNKNRSIPFKATGIIKGTPILPYSFYENTKYLDEVVTKKLTKVSNTLVIQGKQDKTVYDMNWAKEIYTLLKSPKKLIYLNGADHTYKGFENEVLSKSLNWITKCIENKKLKNLNNK